MMRAATTIQQSEGTPTSYPASGLSPEPANATLVWQRIESYISHRWTPRTVMWVVRGPGEWLPPLTPATIVTVDVWNFGDYETVVLEASPLGGFVLPGVGPYSFLATVGDTEDDPPSIVREAVKRLSAYLDATKHRPGIRSATAGNVSIDYREETSIAMALQNSGAADLLRQYRRVA